MSTQFPILTICGSMRFYKQMLVAAAVWTCNGWIVLMPYDSHDKSVKIPANKHAEMLDLMHKTKISMSERVLVITANTGYIGESTRSEIDYAHEHNIPVMYDYGPEDQEQFL